MTAADLDASLTLDPAELRRLGYRAVDAIAARIATLDDAPVGELADRDELHARLHEPLPEHGLDPEAVLDVVLRDVLSSGLRIDHPRFFAFTPLAGNAVSTLADVLVAGHAVYSGVWTAAPGATTVELTVLDWLREICGMPRGTEGLFVSGGSMANLTALAVALEERAGAERSRATVYLSAEAHASVERALRVVGVSPSHIRKLASDRDQRLAVADVASAIDADRAAGRLPVCVVATAGTTGIAAVDPLLALRELCDREGLWFHVDGACGAPAMLSPRGREVLRGVELADSLTLDPHKWLFQPLEAGCVLVRDGAALERTFSIAPSYLRAVAPAGNEISFADRGIELTRSFRALKLWMSMKTFGAAAFRTAIEHGMALAEHAQTLLAADPTWEVVTPAQLGVVTFRATAAGASEDEIEAVNVQLPGAALRAGFAFVNTTRVGQATVLRLCPINPRTTIEDVERSLERLAVLARGAFDEGTR